MDKCQICNNEIAEGFNNRKICPSCTGKKGGRKPKELQKKIARKNNQGYLYYTHTMLTLDERQLVNSRIVLLHRLIMAKHLQRPLLKGEMVMHINGNKLDNRIENLQVGSAGTNTRQHWTAQVEAEKWKRLSTVLLILGNYNPQYTQG